MIRFVSISALALAAALPLSAQELRFPAEADRNATRVLNEDSQFLPTAPFADGRIEGINAEGQVQQTAWKVGDGSLSTMQMFGPLRDQFLAAGFEEMFECDTRACGGFDFRYGIDVMPEPDMHVNLGDFRYFSAKRVGADGTPEYVSLIVSRSAKTGFVQLTRIGNPEAVAPEFTATTKALAPPSVTAPDTLGSIAEQLETNGHATLLDLSFRTGSSELEAADFASLETLAAYLKANPTRRIMLVGHTDAEGPLSNNIVLSRKRATAVMLRLIEAYGVLPTQVNADGVGFLAPRASNLTPEGRTQNRRVEVILTSTQ